MTAIKRVLYNSINYYRFFFYTAIALVRCMRVLSLRMRFRAMNDDDDDGETRKPVFLR